MSGRPRGILRPGGRSRRFVGYAFVLATVQTLLTVRGLALAAILGAETFGVWSLFRITTQYTTIVGLGVQRGLEVRASALGPDEEAEARALAEPVAGFALAAFGLLGLLAAAAAFVLPEGPVRAVAIGLALGSLVERLWLYGRSYLRARGRLRTFAWIELVHALMSLILGVAFAAVSGLYGAFAGFVVAHLIVLALLYRLTPLRLRFSWKTVRELSRIGLPLSVSQLLMTIMTTVDRLVVGALLGVSALGVYALAVAVSSAGAAMAISIRTVVFPDLFRQTRRDGGAAAVLAHLDQTVLPFAWLLTPVLGLMALGIEPVLALVMPEFVAAARPAEVFIFAGVAQGLVTLGTLGVVAAERQRRLPTLTLIAVLLNVGLSAAALEFGLGLAGLAAAVLFCRLGFALAVLLIAGGTGRPRRDVGLALKVVLPVVACALLVQVVGGLFDLTRVDQFALAILVYVALATPIVALAIARLRTVAKAT